MTAVTVQRVKTGTGAVITLASFTLFKSEAVAGRRLSQFDIFDGFNYIGSSVSTDDQMRRQSARLCARCFWRGAQQRKVTISQMGWVLYETQVPAGPFAFRISAILSLAHYTSVLKNKWSGAGI